MTRVLQMSGLLIVVAGGESPDHRQGHRQSGAQAQDVVIGPRAGPCNQARDRRVKVAGQLLQQMRDTVAGRREQANIAACTEHLPALPG